MNKTDLNNVVLDNEELQKTRSKHSAKNQLAFAVMLKFFQIKGYYPTNKDLISEILIATIAHQLDIGSSNIQGYNWESRTAKRFRQDIRDITGYRQASKRDIKKLITWLIENVSSELPTNQVYKEKAYQFFRSNKLEPFSLKQLERYILSASYGFEKKLF
jgi:hypothetical protein